MYHQKKMSLSFEGFNASPSYSPDGNNLAYISFRGPLPYTGESNASRPDSGVLVIRSLDSGQEQEMAGQLSGMSRKQGTRRNASTAMVSGFAIDLGIRRRSGTVRKVSIELR